MEKSDYTECKVLLIRKGLNGFPYSICNAKGRFLSNFNSIEEIREYYRIEVDMGVLRLKKETRLNPEE